VLTTVATQRLGDWTFAARFRFATGVPRTPVTGAYLVVADNGYEPIFGVQNTTRVPSFWQLDLRIDRAFDLGAAKLVVYLEGLNVTDHANAEEIVYSTNFSRRGTIDGLPIVVTAGARVDL
jgi:TonB dependent receptor